jgi:hypothetical protein
MKRKLMFVLVLVTVMLSAKAANSVTGTADVLLVENVGVKGPDGDATTSKFTGATNVVPGLLHFGAIGFGATSSEVVLTPLGAISTTGDALLYTSAPVSGAGFEVTGSNVAYKVTFGASTITINKTGGLPADVMTVKEFKTNLGTTNVGTISSGSAYFAVGATLVVPATGTVATGSYTGQFSVTVTYN